MSLILTGGGIQRHGYSSTGTNAASVTSQALDPDSGIHYVFGEMSYTSESANQIQMTCLDSSGNNINVNWRTTKNGTTTTLSGADVVNVDTTRNTLGNLNDTTIGGERLSFMLVVDNKVNLSGTPYSIPCIFGSMSSKDNGGYFNMCEMYIRTAGVSAGTQISQLRFTPKNGTGSIEQWRLKIYKLTSS